MNGSWQDVAKKLGETLDKPLQLTNKNALSGGCINQSWKVHDTQGQNWFVKTNKPSLLPMFEAEAAGVEEIRATSTIRAPQAYCFGSTAKFSYLVLEYIPLNSTINQTQTGAQLAALHQHHSKQNSPFGWHINNTIGSTPQSNRSHDNWKSFYKEERLLFQLNLAKSKGYPAKAYESGLLLAEKLSAFFSNYQPKASLLHGDLWGGNCASDDAGNPVIFDPASYYGDRETDLAMTELFGGFNQQFYDAYNDYYPVDSGYKTRKTLYNLYHILNHYNLFGGGYASQAESMTQKCLSQV